MTQRIFDKNNPQDMKDLFDILPDDSQYVQPCGYNDRIIEVYNGKIWRCAPIAVNFHGCDKIYRPTQIELGAVGYAWDDDGTSDCFSTVFYRGKSETSGLPRCSIYTDDADGSEYDHFLPITKDDVYFDKNGHMHIKESVAKAL